LVLMRELARRYIKDELGAPTASTLYGSRNRLEPWEALIEQGALATLKSGGTPPTNELGLDTVSVGLGIWPDPPMAGLMDLTMRVDAVHEGAVRLVLFNDRMTMMFVFVLDFQNGRVHTQLEQSSLLANDQHRPVEEDVRAFHTVFHRVLGNAVVELRIHGRDPVECEEVIPVNIIPRTPSEAVEEAVAAFRHEEERRAPPA
jgi:hypothetical protein